MDNKTNRGKLVRKYIGEEIEKLIREQSASGQRKKQLTIF